MKKTVNKCISVLLACVMALTLLPAFAGAESNAITEVFSAQLFSNAGVNKFLKVFPQFTSGIESALHSTPSDSPAYVELDPNGITLSGELYVKMNGDCDTAAFAEFFHAYDINVYPKTLGAYLNENGFGDIAAELLAADGWSDFDTGDGPAFDFDWGLDGIDGLAERFAAFTDVISLLIGAAKPLFTLALGTQELPLNYPGDMQFFKAVSPSIRMEQSMGIAMLDKDLTNVVFYDITGNAVFPPLCLYQAFVLPLYRALGVGTAISYAFAAWDNTAEADALAALLFDPLYALVTNVQNDPTAPETLISFYGNGCEERVAQIGAGCAQTRGEITVSDAAVDFTVSGLSSVQKNAVKQALLFLFREFGNSGFSLDTSAFVDADGLKAELNALLPALTLPAEENDYAVGDLIEYGSYPQTRVDETEALADAAGAALWCSYDYYFRGEAENVEDFVLWYPYSYYHGDWMQFADFFCGGEKYRAVRFTQYRAVQTTSEPVAEYSQQDDNGYDTDTTYYFRYEPLTWRVLDPDEGLIMCVSAIDAQPFHRTCYGKFHFTLYYQNREAELIPVCDYTKSSLRNWLNTDFFQTAFTDGQKENLQLTHREESTAAGDLCNEFSDRVFLLSVTEVTNDAYGFSSDASVADPAKAALPTDYALAQGYASSNGWWLRSSEKRFDFKSVRSVCDGKPGNVYIEHAPLGGVRPACRLSALTNDAAVSDTLYSAAHEHTPGETVYENEIAPTCTENGTRDEVVYCVYCDYEFSRTQAAIPALGHHFIDLQEIAPTCTRNGKTAHRFCTRCGTMDPIPQILPALGHSFTSEITTPPTCTEAGVRTYTCERCDETYTEEEPALGHGSLGYDESGAPSTCTVRGYQMTVCLACGEITAYEELPLDPTNHTWGEWTVSTPATYLTEGVEQRVCSLCGGTETRPVPVLVPEQKIEDPDTGIELCLQNGVLPENTEFAVDEVFDGTYFRLLNRDVENTGSTLYNITPAANGVNVQPDGWVLVRLPIPAGYNPDMICVYYISTETGVTERIDCYIEGGFVCFQTNHFSVYGVVDTSAPAEAPTETPTNNGGASLSFFARIAAFFRSIAEWFRNLFNK